MNIIPTVIYFRLKKVFVQKKLCIEKNNCQQRMMYDCMIETWEMPPKKGLFWCGIALLNSATSLCGEEPF